MAHEHEHHHEHKHEHHHGHKHEHHHGHEEATELAWAHVKLEAHTHEQAATVSMDIHPKSESSVVFANLVDIMQEIARASEQAGGIVGHIKAFAKRGDAFAHASVTAVDLPSTCDGDQSLALDSTAEIQLVAIALLIDQDDLLAICKQALSR